MTYLDQMFSLSGKVAVVTGATRGLGLAIADGLLRAGATVILVGSNEQRLDDTARVFKDEGLSAFPFQCDLAEPQQIEGLVQYVAEQHQRIDVLVNNAGVTFLTTLMKCGVKRCRSISMRRFNYRSTSA